MWLKPISHTGLVLLIVLIGLVPSHAIPVRPAALEAPVVADDGGGLSTATLAGTGDISQAHVARSLDGLPLYFVENQGQTDESVAFYIQGSDKTIFFTSEGVTYALTAPLTGTERSSLPWEEHAHRAYGLPLPLDAPAHRPGGQRWVVMLDFVGANLNVQPVGEVPTEAVLSYFHGQLDEWRTGVSTYARIRYPDLWPGIDLVYSGHVNELKYEFVVQPGVDPAQIQLAYRGASDVRLTADGQLAVSTPLGGFHDAAPKAYQERAGQHMPVEMAYAPLPHSSGRHPYGFELGPYDPTLPLVLDPAVLIYAGYIGGTGGEYAHGVAVDGAGNTYIAGHTNSNSNSFPVTAGPDLTHNGGQWDAFVAKVNAAGTALVYAGYIGGAGQEGGFGMAVDDAGNAYIAGNNASDQTSFPATIGPDLTHNGDSDAFVAKVNAAGSALVYVGYIGGVDSDGGSGTAVDDGANAHITGSTRSDENSFPVIVGPDLEHNGSSDAFVAKVNAAGTSIVYAGYVGGINDDISEGIVIDAARNSYLAGWSFSDHATFPVTDGPDLTYYGGKDAFVAKVNAAGTNLVYASYIGGGNEEIGPGIAIDVAGNTYVVGSTVFDQNSFPVFGGPDLTYNGGLLDSFVAKFSDVPYYSIAGRVIDINGAPMAGVTISVGSGHFATATANGYYTITNVLGGSYIITPTLSGYSFSPVTRTVIVPPDAAGQDFTFTQTFTT